MSLEETAKAEVLEECGYEIPLNNLGKPFLSLLSISI